MVDLRLTARGGRDAIDGSACLSDGRVVLTARVRAPSFEGQANAALRRLCSRDALHVAPRDVALVAGASAVRNESGSRVMQARSPERLSAWSDRVLSLE